MGICMATNVCQPSDSTDINANNSWTRQQSAEWHRHTARKMGNRTISEPIMVVDASVIKSFAPVNDDDSNTISFKRPPKVPLVIQRTISGHDIYDAPDIPIIFVLGGPVSGKLSHCNRLSQMDGRIRHLEMLTPFLEVSSIIGSRDPNAFPAYKALEVFISRMSGVIAGATAILVTGYPRSMRDVVEYMAKVRRVDGVIFLDMSDKTLERQIRLGSKTMEMDENLARNEMRNYKSHIIAVANFFDQQGLLHLVTAEGRPEPDVFEDFYEEIRGILAQSNDSLTATEHSEPTTESKGSGKSHSNGIPSASPVEAERAKSIESFTLDDESKAKRVPSQKPIPELPPVVHKDVENLLTHLQARSILGRMASSKTE